MILLANNCAYGGINVMPSNWKRIRNCNDRWCIYFLFKDMNTGQKMRVYDYDMNSFKDYEDRRLFTEERIKAIEHRLKKVDWNPITNYEREITPDEPEYFTDMTLEAGLQYAYDNKDCAPSTKQGLRTCIKYVTHAAAVMGIANMKVSEISRRHVAGILKQLQKSNGEKWSDNMYNFYRAHMMMLFDVLVEWEALKINPVDKYIKKKQLIKKQREVLTPEQMELINERLYADNYPYWRFLQIFYHSGARITEMFKVRKEDVNLKKQEVKYTILKGKRKEVVTRVIRDVVLALWRELYNEAEAKDFIFNKHWVPGKHQIYIYHWTTNAWREFVKGMKDEAGEPMHITADLYSLKHLNSTRTAEMLGARLAAMHNQHSEQILKVYDVAGPDRDKALLKGIDTGFGK